MAISMLYLDAHGKQIAERLSDITYKSSSLGYLYVHNKTWILHGTENTVLFECGSDKRGFKKYREMEHHIAFYVRIQGFKKSGWYSKYYPEKTPSIYRRKETG